MFRGSALLSAAVCSCILARRPRGSFRLQVLVMRGKDASGDEWWLVGASIHHSDQGGDLCFWGKSSYKEGTSQELTLAHAKGHTGTTAVNTSVYWLSSSSLSLSSSSLSLSERPP